MEIKQIVDRMVEIKQESNALQDEYLDLQSKLQVEGESALENTKYKSVSYSGTSGKATVTLADKVSGVMPSLFLDIFGKAFPDLVNQKSILELNAEGKRIAAAVWNKEYCQGSVEEIVNSLSCDEKAKKSLLKKLNGKNFETDKKNLIKIGGLDEDSAQDYAYLIAEIIVWNKIKAIIKINNNGVFSQEAFEQFALNINAAVCVEQSTKITIEEINVSG
ncbi:hypothetical protein OCV67_10990 [Porcipelethomonas ammoniilytica]|uniref:hypothetical protein n=1 Tax=Porcipelethomonas ammoniilytica TaxID=2981722 RepID=UPI000820FB6D|nr:hypothetical protein [Porcipelethomonas ammoniilytica]MCU6720451.1 hypothetical protein [Porcipelethomonas ammoniilytica]SCJ13498.1 Uncharacterised protein [uncultured Ruminococcus sp.]